MPSILPYNGCIFTILDYLFWRLNFRHIWGFSWNLKQSSFVILQKLFLYRYTLCIFSPLKLFKYRNILLGCELILKCVEWRKRPMGYCYIRICFINLYSFQAYSSAVSAAIIIKQMQHLAYFNVMHMFTIKWRVCCFFFYCTPISALKNWLWHCGVHVCVCYNP